MNTQETRTPAPDGRPDSVQPAWRQDFPIDVPQDHYVARREFTKFLGLTSLGFVVGQFWILVMSWFRGREEAPAPREIARLGEVPVGGAKVFYYPGAEDACLLLHPDEQTYVAFDQSCTHLSCAVVPEGEQLSCPCHHGSFECRTGRPLAGPPRRPLTRIALEVRDQAIFATAVELRTV